MIHSLETTNAILSDIRGKRILVIGDVMLDDYIWGDTSRISPEAPVPVVKVSEETYTAGGAANVALNIASLGGDARLFGWMGTDINGNKLKSVIENGGVKVIPSAVSPKHETIVKTRIVCRRQQLCRLDREASYDSFVLTKEVIEKNLAPEMQNVDAIILSDYGKGMLTTESVQAIQATAPKGLFIALDPKPRPGVQYHGLSVMTPNRPETLKMANLNDGDYLEFPKDEVFSRIRAKFSPEHLVVTMGADGMLVSPHGEEAEHIPTVAREVFDVSGAGDTVIAALSLASAAGYTLNDAARFANLAAGFVVGKLGTATVTPEDIRHYASEICNG